MLLSQNAQTRLLIGLTFASLIVLVLGSFPRETVPASIEAVIVSEARGSEEPIQPIRTESLEPRRVALGKRLFHDTRLSRDNTVSCAHCHDLTSGGVDGRARSRGIGGRQGDRNAPTVFNCGLNYRQFWDGRAATIEAQIDGPVQAKAEMDANWPEVVSKLRRDMGYVADFRAVYPEGIQPHTIRDAIAMFERSLTTPGSRFDHYLWGDTSALTPRERKGYRLFKDYGCVACHQGVNVGGNMRQPFGVMVAPARLQKDTVPKSRRYFQWTESAIASEESEASQPLYKVPGLRNVARTAPYFHDGSVSTLTQAVEMMGLSQLGRELAPPEVEALVAFLQTLTGKYEGREL
jgi:cytochrome c peroxidase